jgi:hypothetical protein
MDLERIERALREGPADEPIYQPGAFARPRVQRWLLFAGSMAGAIVLGVIIGLGLDVVRQPVGDDARPAVDLDRLGEELSGSWLSDSFTEEDIIRHLTDDGHGPEDIAAWLRDGPIPGTVRYGLDFDGRDRLVVFHTLDDSQTEILTNVVYELLPNGDLQLIDGACSIVMEFTVDGEELTFGPFQVEGCIPATDSEMAFKTFFGLAPPYQLVDEH